MWRILLSFLFVLSFVSSAMAEENTKRDFFAAVDLLNRGFPDKALPFLKNAIEADPNHAPTYSRLAECLEKLNRHDEALPAWQKYISLAPRMSERVQGHVGLLKKYVEAMELQKSLDGVGNAGSEIGAKGASQEISPTASADASDSVAKSKDEKQGKIDALLFEVANDPYHGSPIAEKAIRSLTPRMVDREKYAAALPLIKRASEEFPSIMSDPTWHLLWGSSLRGTGAVMEALPVLKNAESLLASQPLLRKKCRGELALCYIATAKELVDAGQYEAARKVLVMVKNAYQSDMPADKTLSLQALILKTEDAQVAAWISQGDVYAKQGLFEDAIRWYSKVHTLTFSTALSLEAEKRIRAINDLAVKKLQEIDLAISQQQNAHAMKLAEELEANYPSDIRIKAMNRYAKAAISAKLYDDAAKKLMDLASRYSDSEDGVLAYANVGYMYGITTKNPQKGLAIFQQMLSWRKDDARAKNEALLGTGIMLAILGKKEEASKIFTTLAVECKDNKRISDMCRDYIWKCKNCKELTI